MDDGGWPIPPESQERDGRSLKVISFGRSLLRLVRSIVSPIMGNDIFATPAPETLRKRNEREPTPLKSREWFECRRSLDLIMLRP